jgi:hypothetical protein
MGNIFSSPISPSCPVCQVCAVCPSCPSCPIRPACPSCDIIALGKDSNDAIIDLENNKKQVLLPSNNKPLYGLLNMPVSYASPLYGPPVFYWEGIKQIDITNNICYSRITNTNATLVNTYYNAKFNNNGRYMFTINNTSVTNIKPTNYIVLKLPINPNTHNSIFIQTIRADRWSNINMYVCNKETKAPVKKIFTNCNSSRDCTGNSSFLGPMNNVAQQGHHEWIQFSVSIDTINTHKTTENEIYVSINVGTNSTDPTPTPTPTPSLNISGVAVVPNNYAVTTIHAMNLCWNCNSNVYLLNNNNNLYDLAVPSIEGQNPPLEITLQYPSNPGGFMFNSKNWNEESLVTLEKNKVCKIHIPIVSKDQDLIFGIITHNNTWYDTSPMIYVDDTLYYLSQLISGRYGFSLQGRGQFRYAKGIYIPKEVIKKITISSESDFDYIPIIINQSKETLLMYIRGMYTEAVQEYIKP